MTLIVAAVAFGVAALIVIVGVGLTDIATEVARLRLELEAGRLARGELTPVERDLAGGHPWAGADRQPHDFPVR